MLRKMLIFVLVLAFLGFTICLGCAQGTDEDTDFPTRVIRWVVPYAPGGGVDLVSRITAKYLEPLLGQPIVIDNRPGAGGEIGIMQIINTEPDGYSVVLMPTPSIILNILSREVGYSIDDLQAVMNFVSDTRTLAVSADSAFDTIEDLVEYGQNNFLTFGNSGMGSHGRFATLDFIVEADLMEAREVPFDGSAEQLTALLGGHVHAIGASIAEVKELVEAGEVRVLLVFGDERAKEFPDAPTAIEKGLGGSHVVNRMLWAHADVPASRIQILTDALIKVVENPGWIEEVTRAGMIPNVLLGEDAGRVVDYHMKMYQRLSEIAQERDN